MHVHTAKVAYRFMIFSCLLHSGSYNGLGEYNGDGQGAGRSFAGRGHGRARGHSFWGRGRAYGHQSGGYYDYGESELPLAQGRGKLSEQS